MFLFCDRESGYRGGIGIVSLIRATRSAWWGVLGEDIAFLRGACGQWCVVGVAATLERNAVNFSAGWYCSPEGAQGVRQVAVQPERDDDAGVCVVVP